MCVSVIKALLNVCFPCLKKKFTKCNEKLIEEERMKKIFDELHKASREMSLIGTKCQAVLAGIQGLVTKYCEVYFQATSVESKI